MKIMVVGLGSMGKRRIRLIKQYDNSIQIIGIDSKEERTKSVEAEFGICTYGCLDDCWKMKDIDAAFVCTSPLSHCDIIKLLIEHGIDVFTEINLVDNGYEEFIKENNVKLFLSSTFLYRKDIQWMIDRIKNHRVNYIYHTGQYLPDWHPWENYNNFFVGNKKTNGCREILAIELPWILACFGDIKKINVLRDKMTGLNIDYPDNYLLQIEHINGNKGVVAVDIVARKAMRRLEVYNENLQISWDGTPQSLEEWNIADKEWNYIPTYETVIKDKNYCENIIENAYMEEIIAFFSWIKGNSEGVKYCFKKDLNVLKLIEEIEGETKF